jgi:LacI family transcriptional regulator
MQADRMTRPTIRDLANEAGVSVSTVNRVLAGTAGVKDGTVQQVKDAAERIGYYGLGTIRSQIASRKPKLRFGFLLHQPTRTFYKMMGVALQAAARNNDDHDIDAEIVYADDLSPQFIAAKLLELGQSCHAVGIVSAVHPLVTQAVDALAERHIPVFALISQLSATGSVNYVGLDNWKVGRTSAWAFHNICRAPGKLGILVGNHRYRCQEMNESGFRSYFREHAPDFQLLEPISTFETSAVAEEMTEKLIQQHPDLMGLYISGGGISGAMAGLRTCGKAGQLIAVGYELMDNTRAGLLDGTLTMVIAHPLQRLADATVAGMIKACAGGDSAAKQTIVLPFDIYTRENI